jgi:hypothetical protein
LPPHFHEQPGGLRIEQLPAHSYLSGVACYENRYNALPNADRYPLFVCYSDERESGSQPVEVKAIS